jgi:hypothetical protein
MRSIATSSVDSPVFTPFKGGRSEVSHMVRCVAFAKAGSSHQDIPIRCQHCSRVIQPCYTCVGSRPFVTLAFWSSWVVDPRLIVRLILSDLQLTNKGIDGSQIPHTSEESKPVRQPIIYVVWLILWDTNTASSHLFIVIHERISFNLCTGRMSLDAWRIVCNCWFMKQEHICTWHGGAPMRQQGKHLIKFSYWASCNIHNKPAWALFFFC